MPRPRTRAGETWAPSRGRLLLVLAGRQEGRGRSPAAERPSGQRESHLWRCTDTDQVRRPHSQQGDPCSAVVRFNSFRQPSLIPFLRLSAFCYNTEFPGEFVMLPLLRKRVYRCVGNTRKEFYRIPLFPAHSDLTNDTISVTQL